nr:IclR family transcriptional regulator [Halalkalibacter oceani]
MLRVAEKQKVRIQSVDRILDIIEEVSKEKHGLSISEIAKRLDLQVSTTYNLIGTLKTRDYIHQDPETKRYFLGVKILSLKNIYVENIEIKSTALPLLEELHEEIPETIHLSICQGDHMVPIARLDSKYSVRVDTVYPGNKGPLYCTATGRALLFQMSDQELTSLLNEIDIVSYTDHTLTNIDAIKEEIEKSKKRGYSQDMMEHQDDVYCIGAPIYNYDNKIIASISISVPSIRFSPFEKERLIENVTRTADKISARVGYEKS